MREIDMAELKNHQLNMLIIIDEYCKKNHIRYSLAYGTLIGAIRHKGYIPWDDDIDLVMPRPDYNRFINGFNGYTSNLHVLAPNLNWDYYAPYANVCDKRTVLLEGKNTHREIEVGVKIDIFPIDGAPTEDVKYNKLIRRIKWNNSLLSAKRQLLFPFTGLKDFIIVSLFKFLGSPFKYSNIQKMINSLIQEYPYENSEYVDNLSYPLYNNTRVKREVFDNYIDIEFENHLFCCVQNYDEYLRKIYGDYLKLPPAEKQVPRHGFTAFWKDGIE